MSLKVRPTISKRHNRHATQLAPVKETKFIDFEESRNSIVTEEETEEPDFEIIMQSVEEGQKLIEDLDSKIKKLTNAYEDSRMKLMLARECIQTLAFDSNDVSIDSIRTDLKNILDKTIPKEKSAEILIYSDVDHNSNYDKKRKSIFKNSNSNSISVQSKPSSEELQDRERLPSNFSFQAHLPSQLPADPRFDDQADTTILQEKRKLQRKKTLVRILGIGNQTSNNSLQPPVKLEKRQSSVNPVPIISVEILRESPSLNGVLELPIKKLSSEFQKKSQNNNDIEENLQKEFTGIFSQSKFSNPLQQKKQLVGPKKDNFIKSGYHASPMKNLKKTGQLNSEDSQFSLLTSNRLNMLNATDDLKPDEQESESKPLRKFPSTFFSRAIPLSPGPAEKPPAPKEQRLQRSFFLHKKGYSQPPENL